MVRLQVFNFEIHPSAAQQRSPLSSLLSRKAPPAEVAAKLRQFLCGKPENSGLPSSVQAHWLRRCAGLNARVWMQLSSSSLLEINLPQTPFSW